MQASVQQFTTLVANIPGAVYLCAFDADRSMQFISEAIKDIAGYPAFDFLNRVRTYASIIHPDDRGAVEKAVTEKVSQGEPYSIEYRIVDAQGKVHWVYEKGQGIAEEGEKVTQLGGAILDVTERKQAVEALRESEARYRTLMEHIPAIIYTTALDQNSPMFYASPQIERILGFSQAEWMAGPALWLRQIHPDDRPRVLVELARSYAKNTPFISEYRMLTRDGQERRFHDEAVIVQDDKGTPLFLQGVILDITARAQKK